MGGLLRRVRDERWGTDEVRQWLGDERDIVVQGLRLLGENAADVPFSIAGEYAYTVGNVAIALLRSWNTEILLSEELARWLRELSPGAAAHVERLRGRDADAALLDFCGTYYPSERMPPFWHREEVSASNFAAWLPVPTVAMILQKRVCWRSSTMATVTSYLDPRTAMSKNSSNR